MKPYYIEKTQQYPDAPTFCVRSDCGGLIAEYFHMPDAKVGAAAPELLAALVATISALEGYDLSEIPGLYDAIPWDSSEAAITKTKG